MVICVAAGWRSNAWRAASHCAKEGWTLYLRDDHRHRDDPG